VYWGLCVGVWFDLLLWNIQKSYATTGKGSVSIVSGIAPLAERFMYLNFRYLVAVFYRLDHPLKRRLDNLKKLNMGRCIAGY
jgi:hypothetical protein